MSRQKASADSARITIRDIAARAGVSVATVSRVLSSSHPVSDDLRTRVMDVVRELDYVPNAHARSLAGAGPKTVAILIDDITGAAFAHVARGIEEEAAVRDWFSLVCVTGGDPERELALVNLMRQQGAAAVVLLGGTYDLADYRLRMARFARSLDSAGSRLVLCGRPPLEGDVPVTTVEYDNANGAFAMTSHLLSMGHRRILVLPGPEHFTTAHARLAGYRNALSAYGLPYDPDLVRYGRYDDTVAHRITQDAVRQKTDFTAVFAGTDIVAAGVMEGLKEEGLSVPDDVSVVGFDDIPLARQLHPGLTTVHVPYEEMGRMAIRLMSSPRRDSDHVVLGTHVVVRQSVRAVTV
ncbi:LacI family DNA-binding transcriptional regulator [Streptomyces shenzhenensis]|uniref:LacI family DNA-binding transcriptional regulator n=1 Tax=Streptomyces shenzhenensis TaxID=943815 RepID=UPI0015F0FBF8|nr:LacI family DNA-binding transcriptional regulator [Streptomyces shenzhenensis]